jgi:hypothetical protein
MRLIPLDHLHPNSPIAERERTDLAFVNQSEDLPTNTIGRTRWYIGLEELPRRIGRCLELGMRSRSLASQYASSFEPSRYREVGVTGPKLAPKNPNRSKGWALGYRHTDKRPDCQWARHGYGISKK